MDDKEFFDKLFQLFSDTTGAENTYWMYEECDDGGYDLHAVNDDGDKVFVGFLDDEADAEFVTAVHGCLADLVRRLHMALDEADRADFDRDSRECRIFELECEVAELKADLEGLIAG